MAVNVKKRTQIVRDDSAAGPILRNRLVNLIRILDEAVDKWDAVSSVPGIQAYARSQIDDNTLDIAAEFTAMRAACDELRNWIVANFPTDSQSGAWLVSAWSSAGLEVHLTFSTAQLSQFRTRADSLLATID